MRALVTGATGFVGAHLCARLDAEGWEVHRVTRQATPPTGPGRTWQADLGQPDPIAEVTGAVSPDVVVHLAARVTGSREPEAVVPIFADTAASTVHVLAAARAAEVPRVVLAGSMEEPEAGAPQSPYAAAKAAAATYAALYRRLYALEVVHLRVHMVYGPAQRDRSKLVPSVLTTLLAGEAPHVSSGVRQVDWVHVDDVCAAIVAACTVQPAPEDPVDVGTGVRTSVRSVVEALARLSGTGIAPAFGAIADRPDEVEPVADVEAAAAALGGWRAAIALEDGLERTLAWHREHG
jgi:UDP-glucose 4-epimerase